MSNLVITNYDNFKDLSYFIGQHKKALEMMDEVQNFYLSFLKSKLIHSYEIDTYPGKVILKLYRDESDVNRHYDVCIKNYDYHFPFNSYEEVVEGGEYKDNNGFRFKITKCKEKKITGWNKQYDGNVKKDIMVEYIDKPYYFASAVDTYYFYSSDKNGTKEKIRKLIHSFENEDGYNTQEKLKKELAELYRLDEHDFWFLPDPKYGYLINFSTEEGLSKFQFILEDDKYLVVYTKEHEGGTRTDRWKTFEYEGWQWDKFYFDINTGNFVGEKQYLEKTYEHQLNVSNGWHPYDDD